MEGNPGENTTGLNRGLCPASCVHTRASDTGHYVTVLCETDLCGPVRWTLLLSHLLDGETDNYKAKGCQGY